MNLEMIANEHCACGENPLWDDERQLLFWCDIPSGQIWAFDPRTNSHRLIANIGQECGAFTLEASGQLLLLLTGDAALLDPDSGRVTPLAHAFLRDTERFNDCIAAPDGTVFAGTVDWSRATHGGLFHLHRGFENHRLTGGSACSNGLGWTPDGRALYWADSTARTLWKFDYDPGTGELGEQNLWLHTPSHTPDGLTVDRDGGVWLTFFDGPFLRHYDADAREIDEIRFPTRAVTSCIFGGPDLDQLYITTAGGRPDDAPDELSGALFRFTPGVRGMREFRSQLG